MESCNSIIRFIKYAFNEPNNLCQIVVLLVSLMLIGNLNYIYKRFGL